MRSICWPWQTIWLHSRSTPSRRCSWERRRSWSGSPRLRLRSRSKPNNQWSGSLQWVCPSCNPTETQRDTLFVPSFKTSRWSVRTSRCPYRLQSNDLLSLQTTSTHWVRYQSSILLLKTVLCVTARLIQYIAQRFISYDEDRHRMRQARNNVRIGSR